MNKIKLSLLAGACSAFFVTPAAQAQQNETLPAITVEAPVYLYTPGISYATPGEENFTSHGGGDFLRNIPGVDGGRLGGHGIDPVIRGQQQTQLNIMADGAFVHGGCPNRMDPPTSFTAVSSYDEIKVVKGYQSVQNGPGGTGGTVLFERAPRGARGDEITWSGEIEGGYTTNSSTPEGVFALTGGNNTAEMRFNGTTTRANNYKDGSGKTVRSAFDSHSLLLMPTWFVSDNTTLTLGLERLRTDDALFAGAAMDAPLDETFIYRAKASHDYDHDILQSVNVEAYKSMVDHMMDNYSLRTNTGMKMRVYSDSDTLGGKITTALKAANLPFTIGIEHHSNNRDARRYSGMAMAADATTEQSYMWPDATIAQSGLFVETEMPLSAPVRLRLGGRYDYVKAQADKADAVFGTISANTLYTNHYGYDAASDAHENNFGGLARLEYDLSDDTTLFAGVSRSVRTADATERFMAANSGTAAMRWVGNPHIDPEAHHQLDVGLSTGGTGWSWGMNAYYDDVRDFIMRDTARGQDGIVANSGETIYRNIDATLAGAEMEGQWQINGHFTLDGALTYTYGENDEDNDALAQIPPLTGHIALDYTLDDTWSFGGRTQFATQQTRIDDNTSTRDVRKTPGYATIDLYGQWAINPAFTLRFGVDNILDHDYARHINRSSAFDATEVQVNEPGRAAYMRLKATF